VSRFYVTARVTVIKSGYKSFIKLRCCEGSRVLAIKEITKTWNESKHSLYDLLPVCCCNEFSSHVSLVDSLSGDHITTKACLLRSGLISLWLYKENKLRDWNNIFTLRIPPSSTHLWLRCSNFFIPSKKNSFGCAANRKIGNRERQKLISTPTYTAGRMSGSEGSLLYFVFDIS
jgi:hypothetical protein